MSQPINCIFNRDTVQTSLPAGTVTLDFIRHHQNSPGTKEGCREGECGACAVLLGQWNGKSLQYQAVASCLLPLGEIEHKHLVTIEGLNREGLNPVQQALLDEGAAQCGFCIPGIVLSLTGFFLTSPDLAYQDGIDALDGNICRCTGYASIRRAVKNLHDTFAPKLDKNKDRLEQLLEWEILPPYFADIPAQLKCLAEGDCTSTTTEKVENILSSAPQGEEPVLVAGATDLYVQRPEELADKALAFVSRCTDDACLREENGHIIIGAGTTVTHLKQSPLLKKHFPKMSEYMTRIASTLMRNRATVAGNIMNASPIGDLSIIMLALQAHVVLAKKGEKREVPLIKFFLDYKKLDRRPGEVLKRVHFPVPAEGWMFHFEKVSQRHWLDIASVNSAITLKMKGDVIEDIHISAGGVAPVPFYLQKTVEFLEGKQVNGPVLLDAAGVLEKEIAPISDVRGSAQYKTSLLRRLLFAHFISLFPGKKLEEELL